jgi:hypothetical protein
MKACIRVSMSFATARRLINCSHLLVSMLGSCSVLDLDHGCDEVCCVLKLAALNRVAGWEIVT